VADALPDKRCAERALRDAGFSNRQARKLVSAGWPALGRDDDDPDPSVLLARVAAELRRLAPIADPAVDVVESSIPLDVTETVQRGHQADSD
jgi:hypothetical protein